MKKIINTELAPKAIGPYSQGTSIGNLVFTSGQLPLDLASMKLVEGGIREQATQSLANLSAILEESGASIQSTLKTTCYLANIEDFAVFNEVYSSWFGGDAAPARSCFEVAKLPMNALIEIEAIAYVIE